MVAIIEVNSCPFQVEFAFFEKVTRRIDYLSFYQQKILKINPRTRCKNVMQGLHFNLLLIGFDLISKKDRILTWINFDGLRKLSIHLYQFEYLNLLLTHNMQI